jgi:hypothetical protein
LTLISPILDLGSLEMLHSALADVPPPPSPTGVSGNLQLEDHLGHRINALRREAAEAHTAPMPDLREGEGDVS